MKSEIEKFHTYGQSIWVEEWRDGKTIFCRGQPGRRIWVEHCPKCGERLSLEELHEADWKWEQGERKRYAGIRNTSFSTGGLDEG